MLEQKSEFCLCKHCSMEKNKSVLWQPFPMSWDFCVILMRFLWLFDSGRPIFGIFLLIHSDSFLLKWVCCHLVILMDWFGTVYIGV